MTQTLGNFKLPHLANTLPVPEPLSEVTDLANVIGFVKRQKRNYSTNLSVKSRWTLRRRFGQRIRSRAIQRSKQLLRQLLPGTPDFVDSRKLFRGGWHFSAGEQRRPRNGPLLAE